MQIDTSVSEADVGALKDGLPARFVVDAYPSREFNATMRQFRLAPNVVQNVVTYNVVLDVDNKDELLKPGMTAQVRLVVDNRPNVLRIPTTALRFRLSEEEQEKQRKRTQAEQGRQGRRRRPALPCRGRTTISPSAAPARPRACSRSTNSTRRTSRSRSTSASACRTSATPKWCRGDLKAGDRVVTRSLAQPQDM